MYLGSPRPASAAFASAISCSACASSAERLDQAGGVGGVFAEQIEARVLRGDGVLKDRIAFRGRALASASVIIFRGADRARSSGARVR